MSAFICRCMWTRTHLWIFFFVNFANKFWKGKKVFTLSLLDPSVKSALPEFLFSAGWSSRAFRESSFISKCEYLDRNVSEKKVLLMNIAIRETFRKSKTFFLHFLSPQRQNLSNLWTLLFVWESPQLRRKHDPTVTFACYKNKLMTIEHVSIHTLRTFPNL